MKDTSDEMRAKQIEIILSKTPEERFRMGIEMMEEGRQIVLDGIRKEIPGISQCDLIIEFIKRYYGHEFTPEYMASVVKWMKEKYKEREGKV